MSERNRPAVLLAIVSTAWGLTGSPILADATGGPGSLIWENSWDRRGISNIAEDFAMSPDGSRLFLTGWSAPEPVAVLTDYTTAAFDASTGDVLWGRSYAGPGGGDDEAFSVAVSPEGERVYVTGSSVGTDGSTDIATIAYEAATGAQLWVARFNGSPTGDDRAEAIVASSDGARVYVTGTIGAEYGHGAMTTVAYDAESGAQLWMADEGSDRATNAGAAIALTPEDTVVYVTGVLWKYGYDIGTVAYDAMTGEPLWVARWDNPEVNVEDYGVSLAVTPDGTSVLVGGYTWDRFEELRGEGFVTLSYDALTGSERWMAIYRGTRDGDDYLRSLVVAPDGRTVYVAGPSGSNNNDEMHVATVAYDTAAGGQVWDSRNEATTNTYGADLAVRPDGSTVYGVDDMFDALGNQDIGTFAFDAATGAVLWRSRFDSGGPQEDIPAGVQVSPDGERVFVGGHSWYGPRSFDFAVLAYEA